MPRAEAGSAKAIGNAIKAKGLTKLRFYCQICQKACRDENGYKCHIESEAHMRQMAAIGPNAAKTIDNFSRDFQDGFVQLLSRRFGTRRIKANQVYQEYIAERHHTHMNATRWVSLSEFVKHLGREGIAHVEEMDNGSEYGWYISWIDNSPAALKKQDALQKMERAKVDEEGRARKFLNEQIERAKEEEEEREKKRKAASDAEEKPSVEEGLQKDGERKPIKLGISFGSSSSSSANPAAAPTSLASSSVSAITKPNTAMQSASPSPFKLGNNPLKMKTASSTSQATKPVNPLKLASSPATSTSLGAHNGSKAPSHATMAERIMQEEQERKEKRKLMGPQPSEKRMRL